MGQQNIATMLDWYRTLKSGRGQKIILTTYKNGKANKPRTIG